MSNVEKLNFDFFVDLFNRRLHKILENIIFVLDAQSILTCLQVNCEWCKIVIFYCESKNPKFQKLQNLRITEEWWRKNPVIYKISLEKFNISLLSCLHIIGDEREVLIAALINGTKTAKIILIDSKTVAVKKILDLPSSKDFDLNVLEIKLSINNNFLVAYIHDEKSYFYQIWNRNENFMFT